LKIIRDSKAIQEYNSTFLCYAKYQGSPTPKLQATDYLTFLANIWCNIILQH